MSDSDSRTYGTGSMFEHPYPVYDQDNPPPTDDINEPLFNSIVLAQFTPHVLTQFTPQPQEFFGGPYDLSASHSAIQFDTDMLVENIAPAANLCPPSPCWVCCQVFCACDLNVFNNASDLTAHHGNFPPLEPCPPPLPPPRHIEDNEDLRADQDPAWQWGNLNSPQDTGFGGNQLATARPGSSSGYPRSRQHVFNRREPSISRIPEHTSSPVFDTDWNSLPKDPSVLAVDFGPDHSGQASHTPEGGDPNSPVVPESQPAPKAARKRARIKDATFAILDQQFGIDAYPKAGELSSLVKATNLTLKEIKTWFTNARSRRQKGKGYKSVETAHGVAPASQQVSAGGISNMRKMTHNSITASEAHAHDHAVSKKNLESLDRTSPVASVTSLDRYMARPLSEELSADVEEELKMMSRNSTRSLETTLFSSELPLGPPSPPVYTASTPRAYSRAGSVQSFGSAWSQYSFGSIHSADSRGSRRGRKQWTRINGHGRPSADRSGSADSRASCAATRQDTSYYPNPAEAERADRIARLAGLERITKLERLKAENERLKLILAQRQRMLDAKWNVSHNVQPEEPLPSSGEDAAGGHLDSRAPFCTWPDCNATFRHRYDWIRHEGPIHYQPHRWICCPQDAGLKSLPECYICGEKSITTLHVAQQHFSSCMDKQESDRDFYRKDHLRDHIKRVHSIAHPNVPSATPPHTKAPEDLLAAWKSDNSAIPTEYLQCRFCGNCSATWEDRNDHVFNHFQTGVTKSDWMPFVPPPAVSDDKWAKNFLDGLRRSFHEKVFSTSVDVAVHDAWVSLPWSVAPPRKRVSGP